MTDKFDDDTRESMAKDRSRLSRGLLNTIPIVIAGSMAIGLNITGPVQSVDARREKPKSSPSELGKNIREAFTAAARAAITPLSATTSHALTAIAATAPATYTVVAGDTVSGIAGRYGLATASVLALNGLGWKSMIFAGQQLKLTNGNRALPAPVEKAASSVASNRYSIVKGDTIGAIAARFGIPAQTLLSANGLGWASIIYPGQTLAIPGASSVAALPAAERPLLENTSSVSRTSTPVAYTIAAGDTVASIAAQFGLSSQALLAANNLSWSSLIYAGRSLTIPAVPSLIPTSATSVVSMTAEMATHARTIVAVGRSLGVPDYGLIVALAAAAQETNLRNLGHGDRDSLGLFQQRPSAGWGTAKQIMSTEYAARLFFGGPTNPNRGKTRGLLDIAGWQSKSVTDAAQAVQLSGYPQAYAKWEASARSWLKIVK